MHHIK
jgi:hypothetical protein